MASTPPHRISVCVNVKDEEDYIEEFICYYVAIGVDHFYVYDNESAIPVKSILTEPRYADLCTIVGFPGVGIKMAVMDHFLKHFARQTEWVLCVDIDEFVCLKRHDSLMDFVNEATAGSPHVAGIVINWIMFGFGGHFIQPAGLVIDNYVSCRRDFAFGSDLGGCMFVKSITKTSCIVSLHTAHCWAVHPSTGYVDCLGRPFDYLTQWNCSKDEGNTDVAQVNHYYTRSEQEYTRKMQRPRDDNSLSRSEIFWEEARKMTGDVDTTLKDRWSSRVHQLLGQRSPHDVWLKRARRTHVQLNSARLYSCEPRDGIDGLRISPTDALLVDRVLVLRYLIARYGYVSYLEIGCCDDECFSRIQVTGKKVGVDPCKGGNVRATSDEFFRSLPPNEKFDLIFIDGLHEAHQVQRDIINSLERLNDNGTIVMHDCLPLSELNQMMPRVVGNWTGDVWKAAAWASAQPSLSMRVIEADWGLGIIRKRNLPTPCPENPTQTLRTTDLNAAFNWEMYRTRRRELMQIVDFDGFIKWLDDDDQISPIASS